MRHIRVRRRFKVILILLFIMCVMVLIENRIEDLIPRLKSLAEAKVEDALGNRTSFIIGSIGGGVVHPIVLNDIHIKPNDSSQFLQSIVIDSIRTNYYIKDVIGAITGAELPPLLGKDSSTYVNFSIKNDEIRGFVGLYGDLSDSRVDGCLILSQREKVNFNGYVRDGKFDVEIKSDFTDGGSVNVFGALPTDNVFTINIRFEHLKLRGFDIFCNVIVKNSFIRRTDPSEPAHVEGEFEARDFILNFKPFTDIKASYKVANDSLEIKDLSVGDLLKAYGRFSLKGSGDIDLTLVANNMNLSWVMQVLGKKEAKSVLTGAMSGKFEFKGPIRRVKMTADFDIRGGTIGELDFDYLTATLRGELPFLKIEESRITRKSGYFSIAGELDLRRIGKENMFDDLRLVTDDTAITWDEWSSRQRNDVEELTMNKDIIGGFGFGYKKFVKEGRIDESVRDSDEAHFNYVLQPNDSLKVAVGQNEDFFGFEHKDKF